MVYDSVKFSNKIAFVTAYAYYEKYEFTSGLLWIHFGCTQRFNDKAYSFPFFNNRKWPMNRVTFGKYGLTGITTKTVSLL